MALCEVIFLGKTYLWGMKYKSDKLPIPHDKKGRVDSCQTKILSSWDFKNCTIISQYALFTFRTE